VLVEVAIGFRTPCLIERAYVLRLAMDGSAGIGTRIVLLTFGALSHRPEVDQFSHRYYRFR